MLNRIWNRPGSQYAEKIKHSVEPYFNVQRISAIDDFEQFVQIDGVDTVVGKMTRVSYGVNNRVFRKPGGGGHSTEMLNVALGQSYYTDARAAQYDQYYQTSTAPRRASSRRCRCRCGPGPSTASTRSSAPNTTRVQRPPHDVGRRHGRLSATGCSRRGWSQRRFIEGLSGFDDPARLDHYLNSASSRKALQNRIGGTTRSTTT